MHARSCKGIQGGEGKGEEGSGGRGGGRERAAYYGQLLSWDQGGGRRGATKQALLDGTLRIQATRAFAFAFVSHRRPV
jgi:hypothetical protein